MACFWLKRGYSCGQRLMVAGTSDDYHNFFFDKLAEVKSGLQANEQLFII
jgi:hypothetical protein